MMDEKLSYKNWLIQELIKHTYDTVGEAHSKANRFMESSHFAASYERWKALKLDVILAANPAESIKFPNV